MATRRSKLAWQAAKFTGRTTEKAVVGLARWATTDHTGISRMPGLGFVDTLKYSAVFLLISLAGNIARSSGHFGQRHGHRLECSAGSKNW